jgi:transcriptional regulator with GAF, ATPase, and Fis domain
LGYSWPGNVRELENIIERGIIVSKGDVLESGEWLPKPTVHTQEASVPAMVKGENREPLSWEEMERNHILEVLTKTKWKIRGEDGAARILKLNPTTLEAKMKKLQISRSK